jgi:hypothetical protein
MADQSSKKASEMAIGEIRYCSIDAHYVGPRSPIGESMPDASLTSQTFLRDVETFPEPSPLANLKVERLRIGYSVTFAPRSGPRWFEPVHAGTPLPIVGHNRQEDY